nr:hypothetical transcript [Hymenolepis microstoma]
MTNNHGRKKSIFSAINSNLPNKSQSLTSFGGEELCRSIHRQFLRFPVIADVTMARRKAVLLRRQEYIRSENIPTAFDVNLIRLSGMSNAYFLACINMMRDIGI